VIETVVPLLSLRHRARLSDAVGIFKHAKLDCPRLECGYCTDDAGRLLVIASRLARDSKAPLLAEVALFPRTGSSWLGGRFRLPQGVDGTWTNDQLSWCRHPQSSPKLAPALDVRSGSPRPRRGA
jgi:hypothetical protein